jgi:hypothetical protein
VHGHGVIPGLPLLRAPEVLHPDRLGELTLESVVDVLVRLLMFAE